MTSDDPGLREGESYNKVLNRPDLRVTVQVVDERAATRWGWARSSQQACGAAEKCASVEQARSSAGLQPRQVMISDGE